MTITARALNRATLARQLLLARESIGVGDALRQVVALQAQQPASPYLALWNRVEGFDPAALDAAVAESRAVKATLMRITLHLVDADDYRDFREAVEPTLRGSRLGDARFRSSGLTADDVHAALPDLLAYAEQPRAAAELSAWLTERFGAPADPAAWRMLRHYAPLWHAPTGGPWLFDTKQSYVAATAQPALTEPALTEPGAAEAGAGEPGVVEPGAAEAAAAGLRVLVRRYLAGFGPASVADVAQFGLLQRTRVRAALAALAADGEVEEVRGADGTVLYDVPGAPRPDGDTPVPPRLMAMWDSTLLAYADRSRVIPPEYRKHVTRMNGDVLPTLLVDGYVAGVWRVVDGTVEATAFRALPEGAWAGLGEEAAALTAFLADRDPEVYRRYAHWWTKPLPGVEVRKLG